MEGSGLIEVCSESTSDGNHLSNRKLLLRAHRARHHVASVPRTSEPVPKITRQRKTSTPSRDTSSHPRSFSHEFRNYQASEPDITKTLSEDQSVTKRRLHDSCRQLMFTRHSSLRFCPTGPDHPVSHTEEDPAFEVRKCRRAASSKSIKFECHKDWHIPVR